jgi:tetratricopeptide (TPR) repeat protein
MNKIIILLIISAFTIHLHAQDSVTIGKTEYRKGNQQDFRSLVREGNRQYNADKPVDAETSYRGALAVNEKSDLATFNLGDALYRQKKFDEAGKEFEKVASATTDKTDKARAYHNLGNSYLQQQKVKESIEAYKQALRNNPNDADTKYNLSYAMNLLKEQEQQQQNQDNKDNQDNQNQDQKNQDNQDQQNQEQKQNQNQNQDQQDKRQDEMQQKQQQQQQQINREDAQRLLDAIAQEEKELLEKLQQKERAGYRPKIEKNW